jgi:hypothetical protein
MLPELAKRTTVVFCNQSEVDSECSLHFTCHKCSLCDGHYPLSFHFPQVGVL